jgi:hypothetical protein
MDTLEAYAALVSTLIEGGTGTFAPMILEDAKQDDSIRAWRPPPNEA